MLKAERLAKVRKVEIDIRARHWGAGVFINLCLEYEMGGGQTVPIGRATCGPGDSSGACDQVVQLEKVIRTMSAFGVSSIDDLKGRYLWVIGNGHVAGIRPLEFDNPNSAESPVMLTDVAEDDSYLLPSQSS